MLFMISGPGPPAAGSILAVPHPRLNSRTVAVMPLSRDFFQERALVAILSVAASAEAILAAQHLARLPLLEMLPFWVLLVSTSFQSQFRCPFICEVSFSSFNHFICPPTSFNMDLHLSFLWSCSILRGRSEQNGHLSSLHGVYVHMGEIR